MIQELQEKILTLLEGLKLEEAVRLELQDLANNSEMTHEFMDRLKILVKQAKIKKEDELEDQIEEMREKLDKDLAVFDQQIVEIEKMAKLEKREKQKQEDLQKIEEIRRQII